MRRSHVDFATFRDVQRTAQPPLPAPVDVDPRVSPNVGDLMSAAIAAAGMSVLIMGGRTACETDYLAASGAVFPASVTVAEMEAFNRRTLREDMTEADEMARYAAIARFFHGRATP